MLRLPGLLTGLTTILAVAGCSTLQMPCCCETGLPPGCCPEQLPECGRGALLADEGSPGFPVAAVENLGRPGAFPPYRCLGALECQCLAVKASPRGNLLDLEREAVEAQEASRRKKCSGEPDPAARFRKVVLTHMALEERNRSAGQALDFYHRLGEAEASGDILQQGLAEVDRALARARDLKAGGLATPIDDTQLHRQQLRLQTESVQLQVGIQQLNSALRQALACPPPCHEWRFWPGEAFLVDAAPVCLPDAIQVGLAHRPELVLLAWADGELNGSTLAAAQQLLGALSGLLGMSRPPPPCPKLAALVAQLCGNPGEEAEVEIRRQQLRLYRAQREREVVEEISQAVHNIQGQMEVVTLARQRAASWLARVRDAEEKESRGLGSFADTADARGKWLRARRRVVRETAALQRARVQLRQAQGILPAECCPSAPAPALAPAPSPGPAVNLPEPAARIP